MSEEEGWSVGPVKCSICQHRWVSVHPANLDQPKKLECPNCHHMTGEHEEG